MTEVTCAIIIDNDNVLITQRSEKMPHALKWEFPGGKVKIGESPEKCIRREINEELGIRIKVDQLFPSVIHHYDKLSIRLIPFFCSILNGTISLREHKSFKWIPFADLESVDWLEADTKIAGQIRKWHNASSAAG